MDASTREEDLLARWPEPQTVSPHDLAKAVASDGARLVVLDDDPTGSQTVADVPIVTRWNVADLRWAFRQAASLFYVLTNTRSLPTPDARARVKSVITALCEAAELERVKFTIASRGDSTLRGHFPTETDAIIDTLRECRGWTVDGVLVVPAYLEAGRLTIGGVHWIRSSGELIPVGTTEFARDPSFGYRASDLREYVEEKSSHRWRAEEVLRITLADLRIGGVRRVQEILMGLHDGRPVVVDAAAEDDLRILSLAILGAEQQSKRFVYRVGPSFVRARAGLCAREPVSVNALRAIATNKAAGALLAPHGLIVVGSHVSQTTRQLERLQECRQYGELVLDVQSLLGPGRDEYIADCARNAVGRLAVQDLVIATSRQAVTEHDGEHNLAIGRRVSSALVALCRQVVGDLIPRWVVAKGGITSSDIATEALGITRAWVRGTLLPGIISLWEPVTSVAPGIPYVVFPGNVGDSEALVEVIDLLRRSA